MPVSIQTSARTSCHHKHLALPEEESDVTLTFDPAMSFEDFVSYAQAADISPRQREMEAYLHLKNRLEQEGLLKPRRGRFIIKSAILGATSAVLLRQFLKGPSSLGALGLGVSAGLVSTQTALLAHALGHKQVVKNENILVPLEVFYGALLLGISPSWWNNKHNAHHKDPNRIGKDPDLNVSVAILSKKQSLEGRNKLQRFLIKHEYVLPAFFTLQAVNARWSSMKYLLDNKELPHRNAELAGVTASLALYLALMAYQGKQGLLFALAHQATHGVYNSWIFASNHKQDIKLGEDDEELGPLSKQVRTASDVDLHGFKWLISLVQNGLDEQIAHHLFPQAPIENLKAIRKIAQPYIEFLGMKWSVMTPKKVVTGLMSELFELSAYAQGLEAA